MASLYNRATPRQAKVLRMIEGACRNAAHAHPDRPLDDIMARSIAKRAAGTIISQWGDVLAAPRARSEGVAGNSQDRRAAVCGDIRSTNGDGVETGCNLALWGASQPNWRTPLYRVKQAVGEACGEARRSGNVEREEALKDVLRLLSRVMLAEKPPGPRAKLKIGKD